MLGADITVKIIRTLCNFRKMDKIYTLIQQEILIVQHNHEKI